MRGLWPGGQRPKIVREIRRKIRRKIGLGRRRGPQGETPPYVVFRAGRRARQRYGIYALGSCDLRALYACRPHLAETYTGRFAIRYDGKISSAHTSILLQSRQDLPPTLVQPTIENLKLEADYFTPRLFAPEFTIPGAGTFPKRVVALSIAADVVRNLYRHRHDGYLVDPGGWWFGQPMQAMLNDLSLLQWFQKNFENVGKIEVADFRQNLTQIIQLIRERMDAQVVIFNTLVISPGDQRYNLQLMDEPMNLRRRKFNLALYDLSRELDFSIIDMDRILKGAGIEDQADFAHWPWSRLQPIAAEAMDLFAEQGVFVEPAG